MDVQRILKQMQNRMPRGDRVAEVFFVSFKQCADAAETLALSTVDKHEHAVLLERSVVISLVSAVEVYYKDVVKCLRHIDKPRNGSKTTVTIHR